MNVSKEWLTGFIEGEGNFHVLLSKNHTTPTWKYKFEYYPITQFRIFLREDDLEVLENIKNTLAVGKIYKKSCEYARKKGVNSRDQYVYSITSLKELIKLKEFLSSSTFHSKKKEDKDHFFRIVELKTNKKHLTEEGYEEIIHRVSNMNSKNRNHFKKKSV